MSSNFKGVELNYHEVDKQVFFIFRAAIHFRPYLLKSRTKVIVPYPTVRNLSVQKDLGDKISPWMTTLQEYNIEIKPSTVVGGQGICKLVFESAHLSMINTDDNIDESFLTKKKEIYFFPPPQDSWYSNIRILLETRSAPDNLEPKKRRDLRLKSTAYQLKNNTFFYEKFRWCIIALS